MPRPHRAPTRDAYRMAQDGAVIVDVREDHEFAAGHAPGALHLPLSQLPLRHADLPRHRRLLTICQSGNRSAAAADSLSRLGYEVIDVEGGMSAWQAVGLPVRTV